MGDLIQLLRVIPATEVKERWQVTEQRLAEIVKKRKLPLYNVREIRKRPDDGCIIYFCDLPRHTVPRASDIYDIRSGFNDDFDDPYILEGVYFNFDDVEIMETEDPTLLWQKASIGEGVLVGEKIKIDEIRKALTMSPQRLIDFLNDDSNPNRLITSWEEGFRVKVEEGGWRGAERVPFFSVADLDNVSLTVHRLDWEGFQKREKADEKAGTQIEDTPFPSVGVDTSGLESQLAEAKKQLADIEGVRRWNKQFLTERDALRKALAEKDARIAGFEKELASATDRKKKRDNSAAIIAKLKKDIKSL
jgi:hypothetical protein